MLRKNLTLNSTDWLATDRQRHIAIFAAGVVAMLLHESFRFGLGLPGRQGLVLMAILVFVRCSASYGYTGTLAGLGAFSGALVFRDNPMAAMIVLGQGVLLDVAYQGFKKPLLGLWLLPLAAGLVHTLKPLIKLSWVVAAGPADGAFRHGLTYPFITHFAFGLVGGLVGYLAWRVWQSRQQK